MNATTAPTPPTTIDSGYPATSRARTNFILFALVTIGIGWIGVALDHATNAPHANSTGMGLWLTVPALTAIVLYLLHRDGGGTLGLTLRFPHRTRWFTLATLIYPAATAAIVLVGIAAGIVTFHAAPTPGKPVFLLAFLAALAPMTVKNTVEEFIFRGYGTRTAVALGLCGMRPHLLVGVVWALWHLPFYAYFLARADFRATTSLPFLLFVPVFLAGVLATAVVFGELRVQTGSIWPGVVLHTIGGAIVNTLLLDGHLRFDGHGDVLFTPAPNSIAFIAIFALVALLLARHRSRMLPAGLADPQRTRS
jgi:membrane protease YdiL (CAAX protease family)